MSRRASRGGRPEAARGESLGKIDQVYRKLTPMRKLLFLVG